MLSPVHHPSTYIWFTHSARLSSLHAWLSSTLIWIIVPLPPALFLTSFPQICLSCLPSIPDHNPSLSFSTCVLEFTSRKTVPSPSRSAFQKGWKGSERVGALNCFLYQPFHSLGFFPMTLRHLTFKISSVRTKNMADISLTFSVKINIFCIEFLYKNLFLLHF